MIKLWKSLLLMGGLLLYSIQPQAVDMKFSGNLIVPPPCQINKGKDISVNFNKIGINKIDGDNYRQQLDFTLSCSPVSPWELTLVLTTSNPANFDDAAVQSDVPGLGIKVYIDNKPMYFEKNYPIPENTSPKLEAVPIKDKTQVLNTGTFSAAATLLAVYQ